MISRGIIEQSALAMTGANKKVIEYISSLEVATAADLTFGQSVKITTMYLLEQAKAWLMTPLGMATTAVAGIYALVKVVNYFNESLDRSRENLDNLKNEYNNNESELKSLEGELQTTSERISELQSKGKLSFTEQEELSRLQAQNAELERSIHLLEAEQKLLAKEKSEAFVDVAEQSMGRTYTPDSDYNQYDNLNAKIEAYKQLQDELTRLEQEKATAVGKAMDNGWVDGAETFDKYYSRQIDDVKSRMSDTLGYLKEQYQNYKSDMEGVSLFPDVEADKDGSLEAQSNYWLGLYKDFQDKLMIATGSSSAKSDAFNRLITQQFSGATEGLRELGKEGKVTAEMLNDPVYTEFIQKCISLGIITDQSADSLNFLASGFNTMADAAVDSANGVTETAITLESANQKIDSVQSRISTLSDALAKLNDGTLSLEKVIDLVQQFPELAEYVDMSADGFGNLAFGLQSLIQSSPQSLISELQGFKETTELTIEQKNAIDAMCVALQNLSMQSLGEMKFAGFSSFVDNTTESLTSLANLQQKVANGFKMTATEAMELAKVYPEILKNASIASDGQVKLNEEVVNAIISGKKDEINASIDAKIAELEAEKASLTGKMESAQAQLEIAKAVAEAEGSVDKELASYELALEQQLVQAFMELGADEAKATELAAAAMAQNQEEFSRISAGCFDNVQQNAAQAAYDLARAFYINCANASKSVAGTTAQVQELAKAMAGAQTGVVAGTTGIVASGVDGTFVGGSTITSYQDTFNGATAGTVTPSATLGDFISSIELDISSYQDAIAQIDGQIAVLESLRNTSLSKFMDAGSSGSGGSSGSSDMSDATDAVEEYIATIEEYNAALQNLEDAQRKRIALEKKLENTNDLSDKIFISGELIDAYGEEALAEQGLLDAKKKTIKMNVSALENLGFDVEYNDETNRLYIKNLDHLNELTADSVGEYDTLQEATNALRQETEELIDTTQQLNSENSDSAENIEDLTYKILEAKNNIIDYIGEIYETQIEAYQKIVDERKKLIESAKDELNYEDQIKEKVEEIAELQSRIDRLSLDDSRSAQAEAETLRQELLEKQKELSDLQNEHATDTQIEALDKMADDYELEKNEDLDTLRGTVEMSSDLWNAFYQTLQGQTVDLGESISTEIADAWLSAAEAVRQYQGAVDGVSNIETTPVEDLPVYHEGGVVGKSDVDDDETIAVLEDGEVVLDKDKQDTLQQIIATQNKMAEILFGPRGDKYFDRYPMKGKGHELSYGDHIVNNNQTYTFEPHIDVVIHHNGSIEDSVASAFGNKIADAAIDSLYNAFERRGMSTTRGARLKP